MAKARTGKIIEAEMRRELAAWFRLPMADITPAMVKGVILAIVDKGHEAQAHQIFGYARASSIGPLTMAATASRTRRAPS